MHLLTNKLLQGLSELQANPDTAVVLGVYRPVFEVIGSETIGKDFRSMSLDAMRQELNKLPSASNVLDHYSLVYEISKLQYSEGESQVAKLKQEGTSSTEINKQLADTIAKSTASAAVGLLLPQEYRNNETFLKKLAENFYLIPSLLEKNLKNDIKGSLAKTTTDLGTNPIPENIADNIAVQAASRVNPSSASGLGFLAIASLITTLALRTKTSETDQPDIEEKNKYEEAESTAPQRFTAALGLGLGAMGLGRHKEKDQEENDKETNSARKEDEKKTTPLETTIIEIQQVQQSQPIAGPSHTSSIGTGITGVASTVFNTLLSFSTGGLGKIAKVGLGILSPFKSNRQGSQSSTPDAESLFGLSKIGRIFILALFFIIIVIIFGLGFLDSGIIKPGALVGDIEYSPQPATPPAAEPTIATTTAPTLSLPTEPTAIPSPTQPPAEAGIPDGFPIASRCITQIWSGTFSHENNLNAVDIGGIAADNAWIIRATHSGRVINASDFYGYGLLVILEDINSRFLTYYGHMRVGSLQVKVGDIINNGTVLGRVDSRGNSTGDHLHYEIRGPRSGTNPWGSKTGEFGRIGTIENFIPNCSTWTCSVNCSYL